MNQLAVANTSPTSEADDYNDYLPSWLRYLVAAYPAANVAVGTFAVFEDAFNGVTSPVMTAAVRAAVSELRFFPTVSELRHYVKKQQYRAEAEEARTPDYIQYRKMSSQWPTCPDCGERVDPEWVNCPACIDLAIMESAQ